MSHRKHESLGAVLVLLGLWLAMPLPHAFGQAVVSSDILGQITDASGAVIPDATVTVANQSTGFKRSVRSDSSGAYACNGIVSGLYTVTVQKAGFKKYMRTDLDHTASRKLRIDVTLELGEVTETVTVKGATPLIETETAAVSSEERNYVINELPEAGSTQGGRIGYTFFNYLIPGAAAPKAEAASFDGLPNGPGGLRITVDGIRSAESCCQQLPSLEAVDEEKVDTFNSPAEYKTPATVEMLTRQGTNRFHG
ncbi:MAG: carboxypeptidase-like regulatory domain-containing protein, partial [Terriglobia bacterium]